MDILSSIGDFFANINFTMFFTVTRALLKGFSTNLFIFFVTLLLAIPLGLVIALGSMSKFKPLSALTKVFVWVIRGTPLMLQLIVVMFGPNLMFDNFNGFDRIEAALIAFVINYAAYFSEIYRGGIESIPKGQYEAGYVLGMSKTQVFFKVVFMQVIKRITAPMGNEIITLVKDTSLARIIAVMEITQTAQNFIASKALIWPLFYSGAFYLIFCGILTILFRYIEKKFDYYRG